VPRWGVQPGEVVFVDDLPVNVAAARAVGMVAVLPRSTPDTITVVGELIAPRGGG